MITAADIIWENKGGKFNLSYIDFNSCGRTARNDRNKIGAILVQDGGEIKGIWTERDLMKNVITEGFY